MPLLSLSIKEDFEFLQRPRLVQDPAFEGDGHDRVAT
jgi:hypothetical protein